MPFARPLPAIAGSLVLSVAIGLLATDAGAGDVATYRLTVDNSWSERTHPGLVPPDAHFSWIGGGSHGPDASFWSAGALASPGIVQMAETGVTIELIAEVNDAIAAGTAGDTLDWRWWFCPDGIDHPSCGELTVEFEIDAAFPLVSLVTMLGPSPDWFVGVDSLSLRDAGTNAWIDEIVVDLHPWDGGTREANVFQLFGPPTTPPAPVSLITERSGQIITPASLGTFTFTRIIDCPADASGDGTVGFDDLLSLLAAWGPCPGCPADIDGNQVIDFADVLSVLAAWGPCD
jgi:hypothetical protein